MIDNIRHKNDTEYYLSSKSRARTRIPEPINHDEGNRNIYERDKDSKGFLITKTNDLEFTGEGAEFLINQFYTKGVAEDVLMEREIKSDDRVDERWRSTIPVYLGMKELEYTEKVGGSNVAKTKAVEGGLKKLIDARKDDEIDLKTTVDSFGNPIPALQTENILLEPRQIFLRSVLSVEDGVEIGVLASGDNLNARSIPFQVEINSDQGNIDYVLGDQLSAASGNYADLSADKIGNCFMTSIDTDKKIYLNGKVKVTLIDGGIFGNMQMDVVIYEGGNDFTYNDSRRRSLVAPKPVTLGNTMEFTFTDFEIDLLQGDSVAIGMLSTENGIRYEVSETEITITEDSLFPATNCKCLTYKQVINRLLYIITGTDDLLVSDLLTSGQLANDLLTNGFYIREFPDIINEGTDEERNIQFNVSLQQVFDHIEALLPKTWWVENVGSQEKLFLEPYSYTQRNDVTIKFGEEDDSGRTIYVEASDIKRKAEGKLFFGKIELGSEKGGDDYEEVEGLRSINGKATYATINKNSEEVYSKLSPFRLSDVDVELPRRKPYILYPEEDTRYDSDIMCIRAKKTGNQYYLKRWQDTFSQVPTGLYRPDSAYNLDISPAQLLIYSHSSNIATAVYHYPNEKIIFSSSNCNSAYSSKRIGEDLIKEDQPIPNSRLDVPTIKPVTIECTAQITQAIEDKITGKTNGVYNWFGRMALNTGTEIEYVRIMKVDPNKEGKLKVIESYL